MTIVVKVKDLFTSTREGVSKKTDKTFRMIQQENVFISMNEEVKKVPLVLADGQPPYAVGMYTIDPESLLRFGQFGLEVDRYKPLQLVPVKS